MRLFIACLLLALFSPSAVIAEIVELPVEKGTIDLLKSEVFAKPFTIFDQLLYGLEKQVDESAQSLRHENADFTPDSIQRTVDTEVGYVKEKRRVAIHFKMTVSGMNDPWRDVCRRHVREMALFLGVRDLGSQIPHANPEVKNTQAEMFFSRYLGPKWSHGNFPVAELQPFIDSIVILGNYNVVRDEKLAFFRFCALHIDSGRMTYFEHKY